MIQNANMYSVSEVFDDDKDIKYVIPKYQREYVWKKDHWENLLDDLLENEKGHFLGSIICVNRNTDGLQTPILELIDGQQRFTTISILIAAIYKKLKDFHSDDEEFLNERLNLKYRLLQRNNKKETKISLSAQNNNNADYLYVLKQIFQEFEDVPTPQYAGNRRILIAYRYFLDRLNEENANGKVFDLDKVLGLLKKIKCAIVVKIEVKTYADAFTLFETLNNRGEPLSAIDIIKNNLLSKLEKDSVYTIDEAFDRWNRILQNLQDYVYQERFLRQFYNAFKFKDDFKIDRINRATRTNLIFIFDRLIQKNPGRIFTELFKKSEVYNRLIDPERNLEELKSKELINSLLDLERIGAAPSYLYLLYLFSEKQMSLPEKTEVVNILVKYFVRRNLTDFPGTRDLDTIFITLIEKVEAAAPDQIIETTKEFLRAPIRNSSDENFKKYLSGNLYENNSSATRFLLCKLEEKFSKTKEKFTDLWKQDDSGKYIWTIEHILPQGENLPKEWVKDLAGGDKERARDIQINYAHKIGNLTITGYNSKLYNFAYPEKRDRKDKDGNFIGYKNGLYLNSELVEKEKWLKEDIEKRTEKLISETMAIFKI